jgi:hypothetical protein
MMTRIAVSVSLALFAVSIQPVRVVVLDWIDAVIGQPS